MSFVNGLMQAELLLASVCIFVITALLAWALWSHKNKKYLADTQMLNQEAYRQQQQFDALLEKQQLTESMYAKACEELDTARTNALSLQQELGRLTQKEDELARKELNESALKRHFAELQDSYHNLNTKYESQQARFEQERTAFEEKLSLLENAEKQLSTQFENIANKIFEQKSEKFTQTSTTGITTLISPLKDQIESFRKQVSDIHIKEGQERASLKTEILSLKELNKQITEEAAALTNALKGDNKHQGNWGELVLERILTESGLREGHEFNTQVSLKNEEGRKLQPDIVVHLPNDKDIIIDSKVSLVAYERFYNEKDDKLREKALKEHVNSVRGHIKGLSKKDYQSLEGVKTLDYVLMFIPIESAFLLAVEDDDSLIKLALDNQIMLVSPTNLLVALRTINNIWQYEYQNQNAKKIADKAAKMYDKLYGFVSDLDKLGKSIESLGRHYELAMNKLSTGRGNIIRQAEAFKTLGVTPTKVISDIIPLADEDDDSDEKTTMNVS